MNAPGPDDPRQLEAWSRMLAMQHRASELEAELRTTQLRWAAILCSCLDHGASGCTIHGHYVVTADGRIL